jgi:hypothetical protein
VEAKVIEAWNVPTFENWMAKPIARGTLINDCPAVAVPVQNYGQKADICVQVIAP